MIINFASQATEDIFNGLDTKQARHLPNIIWNIAIRKLDMLNAAHKLNDLRVPPANRLESLKGKFAGSYSIRINDQYRIIFRWTDGNAKDVAIMDYH
jgi:toxin HigB-1